MKPGSGHCYQTSVVPGHEADAEREAGEEDTRGTPTLGAVRTPSLLMPHHQTEASAKLPLGLSVLTAGTHSKLRQALVTRTKYY